MAQTAFVKSFAKCASVNFSPLKWALYFTCILSSKLFKFLKHFIFRRKSVAEIRSLGCEYSLMRHKGLLHILFLGSSLSRFTGFSYFLVKLTVFSVQILSLCFPWEDWYMTGFSLTRKIIISSVSWFHISKSV